MTVAVVGGNGQLGAACCAALLERGAQVRATVRTKERGARLAEAGVELVELDVTEGSPARRDALEGCDTVVLSANEVAPRAGDDVMAFDRAVSELLDDAVAVGVRRLVLPSVPITGVDPSVPLARSRRELEGRILQAFDGAVLRLPPFMEAWFALVGSSVPLRGEEYATIGRPSPFLRRFRWLTGSLVEDRGLMLVPGSAGARHAFIAVPDAARACAEAAVREEPMPEPVEVAGPEILSWREVAATFESVLGRRVRIVSTPAFVYAAAAAALGPVAKVPSRTLSLNRYMACAETPWDNPGGGLVDPATMTTVEEFLTAKAALGEGDTDV